MFQFFHSPFHRADGTPLDGGSSFWAGMASVVVLNIIIAVYVIMALMDPPTSSQPTPDPKFVEQARKRLEEYGTATSSIAQTETSSGKAKGE